MLHNNNTEVIRKLSKRSLKTNKMRNIFAILAIALTTLLITTTIAGGITFYNTNKAYMNVSAYGIDADGYININGESLEKLKSIKSVDKIGTRQVASLDSIKNKELLNEVVAVESVNKTAYEMMAVIPIEGTYPKSVDDVLVPTWMLEVLGIDKKVGESITLDIELNGEIKNLNLKICGYYESVTTRGAGRSKVFVSEEFINKYNSEIKNIEGTKTAFVTLKNVNSNTSYDEIQKQLKQISDEIGGSKYKAHPKYDTEKSQTTSSDLMKQVMAVAIGVLLVIFTGYLIIYNIFYISVTRDIKFYGLLKTIGTTPKQLKRIIIKQALTLSIIGIPIGLMLGYAVACFILPVALSVTVFGNIVVVSNSPLIFIISIVFSLVTVLISCSKPGRIAGKVSPIEAVRYVSSDVDSSKKKSKKGTGGAKVHKMAWSNILKSKKRVALSIISISLSAIVVIFTVNATMGMNPEAHADNQMISDISVTNEHFGAGEFQPISEEIISKIKELDIVDEVRTYYSGITPFEDGKVYSFGVELLLQGKLKEEIDGYMGSKGYLGFNIRPDNILSTDMVSLNSDRLDEEVKNLDIIDGEIDKEKFKTGNYIIYYPRAEVNILKAGDKIPLTIRVAGENGDIKEVTKEFEIMAIVADSSDGWTANNLRQFNIEEEVFKDIFPNYKDYVSSVEIELKDGVDLDEADKAISQIILESGNYEAQVLSKNYFIKGIEEMKIIFIIVGGIIALILGFIGALNVINTILTSIISRRIEFAMLESIGMTKKQIKKMIMFEGVYYILLTSALIIPLGLIVAYVAPMIIPIYGGFSFTIYLLSVVVAMLIISIIMMAVPLIGYKQISKDSLVERLRDIE